MGFKMKEPSIIGGTQKHTDAIEAQRSASINVQKANCRCGKEICNCGVAPTKHFVDDVPEHNDGHSDDLQTPKEHKSGKVAKGGQPKEPESYGAGHKKVMKDGRKTGVSGHSLGKDPHWQPHQFKKNK